jgi:hypothetical protein
LKVHVFEETLWLIERAICSGVLVTASCVP